MDWDGQCDVKRNLAMVKVLIIEDRRENIVFIANNILKPMGYDVITARDGQSGLNKAETDSPDLIITDLKLPKMNGLEVLEQLAEKGIHIPTIVMTFHGTEATAVKALRLGASDYLIKPFTLEEMEDALARALGPNHRTAKPSSPELAEALARLKRLEEELQQAKIFLTKRNQELEHLRRHAPDQTRNVEMARVIEQASAWEEDNARLNKLLAQSKYALSKAEGRATALEEAILAQQLQLGKYQKETKRLSAELRNLSEAIRLMSQDMAHQMDRITILTPQE
jgi:DNA-binding response OmpR family regulator